MTPKIILNTIAERIALNVFVNDVDSRIIGHHVSSLLLRMRRRSKNGGQRRNLLLRERRRQLNGEPDFERAAFGVAQSR